MNKKKNILLSMASAGALLLGGCNLLPSPASLIQAPVHASAAINNNDSMETVAKRFLPKRTELAIPNGPIGMNSVLSADFDGDKKEEMVVLYKSKDNKEQVGAFVLKKKKENWEKLFAKKGSGYEISWLSAADITGDGKNELLIGWKVGSLAGNLLEVYSWNKSEFKLLQKINYHKIETIKFKDDKQIRLAIWKKDVNDAFKIDLLKWNSKNLVSDEVHYPSYFPKAVKYYEERTKAAPDTANYWYHLADAQLKANHPELALNSVAKGMEKNMVIPSFEQFSKLKEKIESSFTTFESNIPYEIRDADIHLEIPKEIAQNIIIEEANGSQANYLVTVSVTVDQKNKLNLFTIECFSKDMLQEDSGKGLEKIAETDKFLYFVNRNGSKLSNTEINKNEIYKKAFALNEKMIESVKPGYVNPKYVSHEEENVIKMVSEAVKKYWYVTSGGKMPNGLIETFPFNGLDYRYMGADLNTKSKLVQYLSDSYTLDSIQSYMKRAKIVEHKGKLAQPNADGGSIAVYPKAMIVQSSGNGTVEKFDLKVPLGASLIYEFIHIEFQKTESGWKISSEPGSF